MTLIIAFVLSVLVGDLIAVGIAEIIERFSEQLSLWVFLALFFLVFWGAWIIAVRVTAPRAASSGATRG
jgi:cytochrome c biogenesis factor